MSGKPQGGVSNTRIDALAAYLRSQGVAFEERTHSQAFTAVEEGAAAGIPPHEVAKTVVLHDHGGYLLAVVPASERVDLHKLRDFLGASRSLRLAGEDEIAREFPEYEVGAVPPLGGMPMVEIVDRRLLDADRVLISGGDHRHGVLLDPRDLVRCAGARVADICED